MRFDKKIKICRFFAKMAHFFRLKTEIAQNLKHLIPRFQFLFEFGLFPSRVESGRCQKSKAADVKAADVAQSGRCCPKQPMIVRKRTMFVQKQPMIDLKRPMCFKVADLSKKVADIP